MTSKCLRYSARRGSSTNCTNMGRWSSCLGWRNTFFSEQQYSPQRNRCNTRGFIPNFAANFLAKIVRLNAQQSMADENATFPFSGQKNNSFSFCSRASSSAPSSPPEVSTPPSCSWEGVAWPRQSLEMSSATIELTYSMIWFRCRQISRASMCPSIMSLSSLLSTRQVLTFSSNAWRSTVCVCAETPSTTSTSTTAPSDNRRALLTSLEKSTCPGESIKFTKYDLSQ